MSDRQVNLDLGEALSVPSGMRESAGKRKPAVIHREVTGEPEGEIEHKIVRILSALGSVPQYKFTIPELALKRALLSLHAKGIIYRKPRAGWTLNKDFKK